MSGEADFQLQDLGKQRSCRPGQIAGVRNRLLQTHLPGWSAQKIGRTLRRFRVPGLLKRVAGTTKYYLTKLGTHALIAALPLSERVVLPAFAAA